MRAARSRLAEDDVEAAPDRRIERLALGEPLGPAEDGGERVVQLVGDAGDRLAERGHLLGLQQLVVDVARLVVELLALADIAHERFERRPPSSAAAIGAAGDFDPDGACRRRAAAAAGSRRPRRRSRAARAAPAAPADRRTTRDRTGGLLFGRIAGEAEDQFEVRVGGDRRGRLEDRSSRCTRPRERLRTAARRPRPVCPRARFPSWTAQCAPCAPAAGGFGVGIMRARSLRAEFLLDRRADVAHRRTRGEHLARAGRDVDADRAFDAVLVPLDDVAVLGARA